MRIAWGMAVTAMLALTACETGSSAGSSAGSAPGPPVSSAPATLSGVITPSLIPTPPSPPPPPTLAGPLSLYEFHSAARVVLRVGESVRVSLGPDYLVPRVEGNAMMQSAAEGGFATGRAVEATYTGQRPGRAELVSHTDYACRHVQPQCALPQFNWTVHILVE